MLEGRDWELLEWVVLDESVAPGLSEDERRGQIMSAGDRSGTVVVKLGGEDSGNGRVYTVMLDLITRVQE